MIKIPGLENVKVISSEDKAAKPKCSICHKIEQKYSCPRCNIPYCSLECYKSQKHESCLSNFLAKEGNLQLDPSDITSSSLKMREILSRNKQLEAPQFTDTMNDDVDDDAVEDIGEEDLELYEDLIEEIERYNGDIDPHNLWPKLPKTLQKRFIQLIMSRDFAGKSNSITDQLIPREIWRPWWILLNENNLDINEINSSLPSLEITSAKRSVNIEELKDLSGITETRGDDSLVESISKRPPDNRLLLFVVDVVVAYAFVCRYFNQPILESFDCGDQNECWDCVSELCPYLVNVTREFHETSTECVGKCIYRLQEFLQRQHNQAYLAAPTFADTKSDNISLEPVEQEPEKNNFGTFQLLYSRNARFITTILQDACLIMNRWDHILQCIQDLCQFTAQFKNSDNNLFVTEKKLKYLLAYCKWTSKQFELKHKNELIADTINEQLQLYQKESDQFLKDMAIQEKIRGKKKSFNLIQEL